jgi:hypothetical protein
MIPNLGLTQLHITMTLFTACSKNNIGESAYDTVNSQTNALSMTETDEQRIYREIITYSM